MNNNNGGGGGRRGGNGPASFSAQHHQRQDEDDFVFVPRDDPLIRNSRAPQSFIAPPQPEYLQPPPLLAQQQQQQPPSAPQARVRKVGEKLAKRYDMSEVRVEDIPSVNATIYTVVTLEDSAPELDIRIMAKQGYYALIIKGFNEFIDGPNMYMALTGNPDPKTNIIGWNINPHTGTLAVRCGMLANGAPILEDNGDGGNRKRLRGGNN